MGLFSRVRSRFGKKLSIVFAAVILYAIGSIFAQMRNAVIQTFNTHRAVDVHVEDPVFGHSGEVTGGGHDHDEISGVPVVAIGGGITSKGLAGLSEANMREKYQLFLTFIPSFCKTASEGFAYHFYFGYDHTDKAFSDAKLVTAFKTTFDDMMNSLCPNGMRSELHLVQCSHAGHPTWAQNDAMFEAYLDDADYHYRINDDTLFETTNWTNSFVKTLAGHDPSNVGVVGPNHSGGNTDIMTYDFVHRTHVDVFGLYYPRLFTDWWGDGWVTRVYRPNRSTKLQNVRLAHTMRLGQRYGVDYSVGNKVALQIARDIKTLNRYVTYRKSQPVKPDGTKVISMSLYGRDPKYTLGAIRNAQTVAWYFPGWTLRFYVAAEEHEANSTLAVPVRILRKLNRLGAEIARVKTAVGQQIPPLYWRYLVIDDTNVEYFLIRDVDCRLGDRDAAAISDWLSKSKTESANTSLHCIRDHPKHMTTPLIDGLWGGKAKSFRSMFPSGIDTLLLKCFGATNKPALVLQLRQEFPAAKILAQIAMENRTIDMLNDVIWPLMSSAAYCHDGICTGAQQSHTFPVARDGLEYVGQQFDQFHEIIGSDYKALNHTAITQPCPGIKLEATAAAGTTAATTAIKITAALTTAMPSPLRNVTNKQ